MSYIQYHATGTTGDYITVLLESTGAFYNFKQFELNDHGRMRAVGDKPEVAAVIENTLWGSRDWSDFDEDLLNSLTDKHIIINTSEYYQIRQLRNAGCDWPIIRIKYSKHLAYWIKKAILTKAYSKVFEEDGSKHPNEQKLIEKGLWALLFFKKHLKNPIQYPVLRDHYKDDIWKEYETHTEIDLENILISNFEQLSSIADINKFNKKVIETWTAKQDQKFVLRPRMPKQVEDLLGFNPHVAVSNNVCALDDMDNMLIKFHYPDAPKFNNTEELFTYF